MSDTWVRAGRAAVIVVALITAAISFTHIRDLAMAHGGDRLTAPLLPLAIDGAVAAFTVFMHQARGLALWLSRSGLLLAIGMTVAFNTAFGATSGTWGAVIWSCPALLLVICIEVSVLTVRKTRPAMVKETAPELNQAAPVAAMVNPPVTSEPTVVTPRKPLRTVTMQPPLVRVIAMDPDLFTLSVPTLAAKYETSDSTVARARREGKKLAMANGNGRH